MKKDVLMFFNPHALFGYLYRSAAHTSQVDYIFYLHALCLVKFTSFHSHPHRDSNLLVPA